jgi:hypothetical protein
MKNLFETLGLIVVSCGLIVTVNASEPPVKKLVLVSDKHSAVSGQASQLTVEPLDKINICSINGISVSVKDASGREYFKSPAADVVNFIAGGTAGIHTVMASDKKGNVTDKITFTVKPKTVIKDGGKFEELFNLLYNGMCVYNPEGVEKRYVDHKVFHDYCNWVLDNYETSMGMQYFKPYASEMVDLFGKYQRKDGMIWSFIEKTDGHPGYFEQRNAELNYALFMDSLHFVRQPNENHVEYLYVNLFHESWKSSGDHEWMKSKLDIAAKALDYSITDTFRWSKKHKLLKRPLTIDSWDFQVEDEYTPECIIGGVMAIVPGKTKFGVFFGDNTGYIQACNELSEMMAFAGRTADAEKYKKRSKDILDALDKLSWNGKFFTHYIDEDPTVKRNLGVDMNSQIAQANCYSVNRGLTHEQNKAIIETYMNLKKNLPAGSPGEWYAIYPPFEKGFGKHDEKWQYMNGGVAGHAAGELARGAYENGYENYATDILLRVLDLGNKYGEGKRIWFAYTGSIPPPPPAPDYNPLDISMQTNMDLWVKKSAEAKPWLDEREGNDVRFLPVGTQTFAGIKFNIIDPEKNKRRAAIGISNRKGFPQQIAVPVNASSSCIYLLHTSSDLGSENVSGSVTFQYSDGTERTQYIISGKQLAGWWYPSLSTSTSGMAWMGTNPVCPNIGLSWGAIANPSPEKTISKLVFKCSADKGIYAVLGITLSNRAHYIPPKHESFGGPDNWAASLNMAALMEGLVGFQNEGVKYDAVKISPRWTTTSSTGIKAVAHYPVSDGYAAYQYNIDAAKRIISMTITGSGNKADCHILLPQGISGVKSVSVDGKATSATISKIENSIYADFPVALPGPVKVEIVY